MLPVTRLADSVHSQAITPATSTGSAHVMKLMALCHVASHLVDYPSGVGHWRVHDVGGDALGGQLGQRLTS